MPRKKKRQRTVSLPPVSLGSFARMQLVPQSVENPDWRPERDGERAFPRRVMASVNVRESAISLLASRRDAAGRPLIDAGQVKAADLFRRHWEVAGGRGARSIDLSAERVDGGGVPEPLGEKQMQAARHLNAARQKLGERSYALVVKVAGQGLAVAEIYDAKRDRLTATDNLRAALDDLAELWGLETRARGASR